VFHVTTPTSVNTASILDSIKKVLGLAPDYDAFDSDIVMHVNSIFATLQQLGVGPAGGFSIEDNTATWDTFLADARVNMVRSYMFLRVKFMFDPPDGRYSIAAMEAQMHEFEWRLNVLAEGAFDTDVVPGPPPP
jgi:hypothetical protein